MLDAVAALLIARAEVVAKHSAALLRIHVVTQEQGAEVGAGSVETLGRRGGLVGGRQLQGTQAVSAVFFDGLVVADGFQTRQRRAGLDLASGTYQHFLDARRERRVQHGLHLHRLEDEHRRTGCDLVARRHRRRDDQRGSLCAQDTAFVTAHPMGHAVDLDQLRRAVGRGHQPIRTAGNGHPAVEVVEPVDVRLHDLLLGARRHGDGVSIGAGLDHGDPVRRAAQLQVDRPADLVLELRPAAAGGLEQAGDLVPLLLLVRLDRGGDERDAGVLLRHEPALLTRGVDPTRARPGRLAGDDLGLVE